MGKGAPDGCEHVILDHAMEEIDIPPGWRRPARTIFERQWRKILVLGAVDIGKSSFCRFLYRSLSRQGRSVDLIDSDIGQKDIGPPACITAGRPGAEAGYSIYFVGSVNPVGHFLPVVVGLSRLVERSQANHKVINTSGLILGLGRILKGYKIEALMPDVVVALQRGYELEPLLNAYRNHRIVRLRPSARAVSRTQEARRDARERVFGEYFAGSQTMALDMDDLLFQRSLLFNGTRTDIPGIPYSEKSAEGIIGVADVKGDSRTGFRTVSPDFAENLLCGVGDGGGTILGLGIVRKIDFRRRRITLISPVPADAIKIVQFGDIYVSPEGKELGRKSPGGF